MDILIAFLFGCTLSLMLLGCYVLWRAWREAENCADSLEEALSESRWRVEQLERALWEELPEPEFVTGKDLGLDDDEF